MKTTRPLPLLAFVFAMLFSLSFRTEATPPIISNVRAMQRDGTKLVDIHYDAEDADGDLLTVRIEISDNDGLSYAIPAHTLAGDFGEGIEPGRDKHIVWDAGTDWDGEYSDIMRVMVFAVDAQGCSGMEWGNEVEPGGFLLGQDGGMEGTGHSQHVNIPWAYWLSKYEITSKQYCDFLNAAFAAGRVALKNFSAVYSVPGNTYSNFSGEYLLCNVGDACKIRWNVNKFEVVSDRDLHPVSVTWHGAMAFAQFYGYDLPTDAEWEKAARGPDFDDQGEHCLYTWGNDKADGKANFGYDENDISSQRPVGSYDGSQNPGGPDMVNGYGCYDMTGNAAEWTRTRAENCNTYTTIVSSTESGGTLPAEKRMAGGILLHKCVVPKSFSIMIGTDVLLADSNGDGILSDNRESSARGGRISYDGGTWMVRLADGDVNYQPRDITVRYAYRNNGESDDLQTVSEVGGTLEKGALVASGTVTYKPILPNSLFLQLGTEAILMDDGHGTLSGEGGAGLVNYEGGTWSFQMNASYWSSSPRDITLTYTYRSPALISGIFYPAQEDLQDERHQYWSLPALFSSRSGTPIHSRSNPPDGCIDSMAGFRVIRRYIPAAN